MHKNLGQFFSDCWVSSETFSTGKTNTFHDKFLFSQKIWLGGEESLEKIVLIENVPSPKSNISPGFYSQSCPLVGGRCELG